MRHCVFLLVWIVLCPLLYAKPVNIDEIFTKNRQLRLLPSFSYININRKNPLLSLITIPDISGGNQVINTPVVVGNQEINQDYLYFSFNIRYGVYKRVEIFSAASAFWQHSNIGINGNFTSYNNGDFNSWNLGFLVQAKKEGKLPALLVGGSADLLNTSYFSNGNKNLQYFKGFSIFATSFYTVDPLVFLIQASFRFNLENTLDALSINSGEIFTLNPMIYFAVSPYISLNFGIRYQYRTRDRVDGIITSAPGSSVAYTFGMAYEIKSRLIFFADVERFDSNEYTSNAINLTLSYRI